MSESGRSSGDAGNDRRVERSPALPPPAPRDGSDVEDDDWPVDGTTTALPRVAQPAPPGSRSTGSTPAAPPRTDGHLANQPTTALPRRPAPPYYPPAPAHGGYRSPRAPRPDQRSAAPRPDSPDALRYQPPVGPSWAPQEPYRGNPEQPAPAGEARYERHSPDQRRHDQPRYDQSRYDQRPSGAPQDDRTRADGPRHDAPPNDRPRPGAPGQDAPRQGAPRRDRAEYGRQPDEPPRDQQPGPPHGSSPYQPSAHETQQYGAQQHDAQHHGTQQYDAQQYDAHRYQPRQSELTRYDAPRYDDRQFEAEHDEPHDERRPSDAPRYTGRPRDDARYDPPPYDSPPYDTAPDDNPAHDPPRYHPPRYDLRSGQPEQPDHPEQPDQRPRRPSPRGSHLPPYSEPHTDSAAAGTPRAGIRSPRKLTVTRVAALRSRELTHRGVEMFHRATTADGADKSGLTHLTYAVMANYAVDAALAVALAGTLFFAAATAESTGRVLLYLVITVAPFAVIAPFIGPMLDRLQSGRRLALAISSFGRALLALLMAFNFSHFNPWVIYPCALGNLVLSKAFGVLKAALTPRVLPQQITLVKTNSRLTTFGMIAGGVAGAVAAGLSKVTGSPGALFFTAACAIAGGVLCLRIPAWVESTEGEVPVKQPGTGDRSKKGFPQIVTATLWANSMIRVETGFLALFIAFVVKSQYPQPAHSAFTQLLLLGVIGGAAGVGGFVGNTMGARLHLSAPETISLVSLVAVVVTTLVAVLVPGLATAALVGFVGSTASSLAKVSLDSVIQDHLPEESRASGFGKSESLLQLGWVFGGVLGLLLGGVWTFGHANIYAIGFATITVLLLVGLTQSWLVRSGRSLFPDLPARRSPGRTGRAGRPSKRHSKRPPDAAGAENAGGWASDTDRLARPASTTATLHETSALDGTDPRRGSTDRYTSGQRPSDRPAAGRGRRARKAGRDR